MRLIVGFRAIRSNRLPAAGVLAVLVALFSASFIEAAEPLGPLFDRFSVKVTGNFATLDTNLRVDDKNSDIRSVEIDLESDLGLSSSDLLGQFTFDFFVARRHRLTFSFNNTSRTGVETIATEIRYQDVVFPVNAALNSSFKATTLGAAYTYFFKRSERTAIGAVLRLEIGKYESSIRGLGEAGDGMGQVDITREASTDVPQPQIGFELRQMIGENWRFIAAASGIKVKLDAFDGTLDGTVFSGFVSIEHLTFKYASLGAGFGASLIDATLEDADDIIQSDSSVVGGQVFVRFRTP